MNVTTIPYASIIAGPVRFTVRPEIVCEERPEREGPGESPAVERERQAAERERVLNAQ
jgi:hypothetical protein